MKPSETLQIVNTLDIILEKIAALNTIHGDKVRNLMNSIQALKKENARLV